MISGNSLFNLCKVPFGAQRIIQSQEKFQTGSVWRKETVFFFLHYYYYVITASRLQGNAAQADFPCSQVSPFTLVLSRLLDLATWYKEPFKVIFHQMTSWESMTARVVIVTSGVRKSSLYDFVCWINSMSFSWAVINGWWETGCIFNVSRCTLAYTHEKHAVENPVWLQTEAQRPDERLHVPGLIICFLPPHWWFSMLLCASKAASMMRRSWWLTMSCLPPTSLDRPQTAAEEWKHTSIHSRSRSRFLSNRTSNLSDPKGIWLLKLSWRVTICPNMDDGEWKLRPPSGWEENLKGVQLKVHDWQNYWPCIGSPFKSGLPFRSRL